MAFSTYVPPKNGVPVTGIFTGGKPVATPAPVNTLQHLGNGLFGGARPAPLPVTTKVPIVSKPIALVPNRIVKF